MKEIDAYFAQHAEPNRGCLAALRYFILHFDGKITEGWKYGMPFYFHSGKRFCYLWIDKKRNQPYIGFTDGKKMDHPDLLSESRSRMKILLINPTSDLPVESMTALFEQAISLLK